MKDVSKVRKIAFVGDHLPRKCGIATFTSDILAAVATAYPQSQCLCVSVNDIKAGYEYPEVVRFEIEEQDLSSYLRAADFLNISEVDIVCLQHEFGIFGGSAGGYILAFLLEELGQDASTLDLTHGVCPMREYAIGAFLLDLEDPSKVIGRLSQPLLTPNQNEREGYVPNVVYSCGGIIHGEDLILPYGMSDRATGFALIPVKEILAAMEPCPC